MVIVKSSHLEMRVSQQCLGLVRGESKAPFGVATKKTPPIGDHEDHRRG
jgi:hypothetical protein